jgi:prepilin-type N-terminal cleavage/methylation domain-containing protein
MYRPGTRRFRKLDQRAFTLIELAIVIVALGILAAFTVPQFADMAYSSKVAATQEELLSLRRAIVGNPQAIAGGRYIDRGFLGDVGFVPSRLTDLAVRPDSIPLYDRISRIGWNGPYIDTSGGEYLEDAWGNLYLYQPAARRIISTGDGGDSLSVSF